MAGYNPKIILADELEEIIEYYISDASVVSSFDTVLELPDELHNLILAIADERECSYDIIAASLLEWGRRHPEDDELYFMIQKKN